MERFLVLLVLFISLNARAATPGNAPVLTLAAPGTNTQSLSLPLSSLSGTGVNGVFSLYGYTSSAVSANFYHPLYGGPGTAGTYSSQGQKYRVTTGKTAYCSNVTSQSNTASNYIQLVAGTGTFTDGGSGTAPTGTVWQTGQSAFFPWSTGPNSATTIPLPGTYTFPASYFAGFQNQAASTAYQIHMDCYEQ